MYQLRLTDILAWWGAVVATLVLMWDIHKWRKRGAEVTVEATSDMKFHPPLPTGDASFIFVSVTNNGGQATTITHLAGLYFPTLWHKLLRRGGKHFVVVNHPAGVQLPHLLGPGQLWRGVIDQDGVVTKFGATGRLYCGIFHSASKKGVYRRVHLG